MSPTISAKKVFDLIEIMKAAKEEINSLTTKATVYIEPENRRDIERLIMKIELRIEYLAEVIQPLEIEVTQ